MPWLAAEDAASIAVQFAESCYLYGETADEAPLVQLLQYCSAALQTDISAVASAAAPAAADANVTAEGVTTAASATTGDSACADAADRQPAAALAQAPAVAGSLDHADGAPSAGQSSLGPTSYSNSLSSTMKMQSWSGSRNGRVQLSQR